MVSKGPDGFTGDAHRRVIRLDGTTAIATGIFSGNREKLLQMAKSPGISPDRCCEDYQTMIRAEGEREGGIDFAAVVTPNQSHYEICRTFLGAGVHVVCNKPVTTTYRQAKGLEALAEGKGLLFMITYTYIGYMTMKYAKELMASGAIGEVRTVVTKYPQGRPVFEDDFGGKRGERCCDPGQSGEVSCLGDLGTHVENAVATMTGLKIKCFLAKMDVIALGRMLGDNDSILVEYNNGAIGTHWTSQVAVGHDNSLRIRVCGSKGTIQWFQEAPDKITVIDADNTIREIHRGYGAIGERAGEYTRISARHPEGWLEAMDDLYHSFARCISAKKDGAFTTEMVDYPTIN